MIHKLLIGNVLDIIKTIPDEYIDLIITSPPYWGLRDYGINPFNCKFHNQKCVIGLETDFHKFIDHIIIISKELKRVLKNEGSFYLNLGDSYSSKSNWKNAPPRLNDGPKSFKARKVLPTMNCGIVKTKCLMKIPQRIELKLIDELGFIERNDIIWYKPNHMPEPVKDRLTSSYEHVFHFVKSQKYYYDLNSIREPHKYPKDVSRRINQDKADGIVPFAKDSKTIQWRRDFRFKTKIDPNVKGLRQAPEPGEIGAFNPLGKNPGDVWNISTQGYPEAHFATYPEKLILKPILSSCPINGIILDPFAGSGTTAKVARDNGRNSISIEINEDYESLWRKRLNSNSSLDVKYIVERR